MHLEWLSDFLALANTRNFSTAANARHITQPAFSRRIQALEHWVGVPLIDRSSYPVTLTVAGGLFRASADEIVRSLQYTRDECRAEVRSDPKAISFAALHTLATTFFPGWIGELEKTLGQLHTRMQPHSLHDCVQLLVTGNCAFLLCYSHTGSPILLDSERYPSLKLANEVILPVAAADGDGRPLYTLSGDVSEPFLAYGPDSFLGKIVETILNAQERPLRLELHYENSMAESLKTMAIEGHGIAWLPESCAAEAMAAGRLVAIGGEDHRMDMDVRIYRSTALAKPIAERLWSLLQENYGDERTA